jgi:NAD(P)-dependent dehydrogenase (short-subunit alcohol dehydrogenase family)
LVEKAAIAYRQHGIRINPVGPVFITYAHLPRLEANEEVKQILLALHLIERLSTPEVATKLLIWLSSDRASFVTGAYFAIDGGIWQDKAQGRR